MGIQGRKSDLVLFFALLLAVALRPLAAGAQDSLLAVGSPSHHQVADLHLKALGEAQGSPRNLSDFLKNSKDHPAFTTVGLRSARPSAGLLFPADAAPGPAGGPRLGPLALRI